MIPWNVEDVAMELKRRWGGLYDHRKSHDQPRLRISLQAALVASPDPENCPEELEMGLPVGWLAMKLHGETPEGAADY